MAIILSEEEKAFGAARGYDPDDERDKMAIRAAWKATQRLPYEPPELQRVVEAAPIGRVMVGHQSRAKPSGVLPRPDNEPQPHRITAPADRAKMACSWIFEAARVLESTGYSKEARQIGMVYYFLEKKLRGEQVPDADDQTTIMHLTPDGLKKRETDGGF